MIELEYTKTVMYFSILFFIVYLYMYCRWRSNYQEGRGGVEIPLTDLNPPHVCACPKAGN